MAKTIVTITLDPEILATARDQAKTDNRSLSNYLEKLILEAKKG